MSKLINDTIVELRELRKAFGSVRAVDGIDIAIRQGQFISFVGPSGCGKTTLLRLLAGFCRADSGEIIMEGQCINDVPPYDREMGLVFQSYALFPHLTVFDNVAYGLKVRHRPADEISRRVEDALRMVDLAGLGNRRPDQLSGGQQQRVALARCVILGPKVLLLDEPLSNLDANLRLLMRGEIHNIQRRLNLTAIYVTHDQEEAMSMSDLIAVMRAGKLEQVGTPQEVYQRPATPFVARFFGHVNLLGGKVLDRTPDGCIVLDTPIGRLTADDVTKQCVVGETGQLMARPEQMVLRPRGQGQGSNVVPAIVQEAMYLGSLMRYTVEAGDKQVLVVDVHNPKEGDRFVHGDEVELGIPHEAYVLRGE